MLDISIGQHDPMLPNDFEVVERKGVGHPDSLADGLAEALSQKYCQYTLKECGAILHHNFDKVGLMGGSAEVHFGGGGLTKRIRVLLNGRASSKLGGLELDVRDLLLSAATEFLCNTLPISPNNLEFLYQVSTSSSPGKVNFDKLDRSPRGYWFTPRSLDDLPERHFLAANDTAAGVGYAPYSDCEQAVLRISDYLAASETITKSPWLGTDIKIMAVRKKTRLYLTLCVPQICRYLTSLEDYKDNLQIIQEEVLHLAKSMGAFDEVEVHLNKRDKYDVCEIYLTVTGSSIESGDEGFVGRGNRIDRLISSFRPYALEGVCGKNPVYHAGKLYSVVAMKIAQDIYDVYKIPCTVVLVSQTGQKLTRPWQVILLLRNFKNLNTFRTEVEDIITSHLDNIPIITQQLVEGQVQLF